MNAMILAAGLGTRLKPLTDNKPKALVEINEQTLLELAIKKLQRHGFNNIIVNVHHFPDMIVDYLKSNNNFGSEIFISDERKLLLDTGGAIKEIEKHIDFNFPVLVYNVDVITDLNLQTLYEYHESSDNLATLAVRNRETTRYLLLDRDNILCGWTNKITKEERIVRDHSFKLNEFAFSGIHVVNPAIFNLMPVEKKFSIVDLYLRLAPNFLIKGYDHSDTEWIDVGKLQNLEAAERLLNKLKDTYQV
ncbi:MAG TPA: nucleotidyltransferase family protein [Ignavibacteriaceae bacterium]|nr:nucleotidyltransferase family protein [Ignavibacteriaceae bacterium]